MPRSLRQFMLIALHELRDAFTSRWAVALLVLFVLIFTFASLGFVKYLHAVERELLELMSLDPTDAP